MRLAMVRTTAFHILERIDISVVSVFRCSCKFGNILVDGHAL